MTGFTCKSMSKIPKMAKKSRREPGKTDPTAAILVGLPVLVAVTRTTGTGATSARKVTARAARFHRLGFVDGQVTAIMVLAMKRINGALAFFGAAHGDKTKTAGAVGFAIHDQVGFSDSAVLSEKLVQVLFGGLEGKISHV
jgi:hypothetical protein